MLDTYIIDIFGIKSSEEIERIFIEISYSLIYISIVIRSNGGIEIHINGIWGLEKEKGKYKPIHF